MAVRYCSGEARKEKRRLDKGIMMKEMKKTQADFEVEEAVRNRLN